MQISLFIVGKLAISTWVNVGGALGSALSLSLETQRVTVLSLSLSLI